MDRYIMVMPGGANGSLTRYVVGTPIMNRAGGRGFPVDTVFINITGSVLIGLLITLSTGRLEPDPNWRLFILPGYIAVWLGATIAGKR